MANTYLTRTPSLAGSTTKATFSAWIKRANISTTQRIYYCKYDNSNFLRFSLKDNGAIEIQVDLNNATDVEKKVIDY